MEVTTMVAWWVPAMQSVAVLMVAVAGRHGRKR